MSCDLLNLIGTANIPAVPTEMCRVTPDVFFLHGRKIVFSARARGIAHTEKYGWLARLGENQKKKDQGKESGQRDYTGTAS